MFVLIGNKSYTRKEFNDKIKEYYGEEAYKISLRLWKEGYIKLGLLGLTTISKKGCYKATEKVDEQK